MTLTLKTATEVDDPEGPGGTSRPIIWTHSENVVELNQGWESFGMNIPYDATSPPDGWYVYPDTVENWNLVMEDVDAVSVCFCAFQPGIGGVQMSWNVGLDNFTVYQGDPIGAQPVPSLGRAGILMLITMMGILAVVMLRSSRQ